MGLVSLCISHLSEDVASRPANGMRFMFQNAYNRRAEGSYV